MVQRVLLYLSRLSWAQDALTRLPVTHQMARRFVCGETIGMAIAAVCALNAKGLCATLDFLGECDQSTRGARRRR